MKRYEIERAVDRAQLPGPSVGLMRALLARINAKSGVIPPEAQPSLSQLASLTGYSRSTAMRHLNVLEDQGWVIRIRPPLWLARTQHVTTAYAMRVPPRYPQARRRGEPRLGAELDAARARAERELAAQEDLARRAADHETEGETDTTDIDRGAAAPDDDLEVIAMKELQALTGKPVGLATGAAAVRLVLAGRSVRNPVAYLLKVLREDPARYMPAPSGPPRFRAGSGFDHE
jgi:DNA-binding transcriptional ArsR family regulator